jgi:CRP/FNR family transcriptional regulator, cyclic AMP receptor protein
MTGDLAAELADHAFLRGMPPGHVAMLAAVAKAVSLPAGQRLFEEGGQARQFWLISTGHVALDLHVPGKPRLIVETLGDGDLVGLSWTTAPRLWQYGAEALQQTAAFELEADAVLALADRDPQIGYQLTTRLMGVAAQRLHATRIRLLDLYSAPGQPAGTP